LDEEIKIRPARNVDAEAVMRIVSSVLREYGLSPDPEQTDVDLFDIEGHYTGRGGAFYLLKTREEATVGCVGIYPVSGAICELRKMYLLPAWRGRGLGKRLLDHALLGAKRLGFRRVVLETASVLKEAISLYRRYGFQPYQPAHLSKRCDQAYCLDFK
jgi:putative acetyltransferase